jgi:dCMP deaminase
MSKYFNTWFSIAIEISKLSKDPNTQVGAVIVDKSERQISIGYNGFAKGFELDEPEIWNDRELKHKLVVHAEINAIANCPFDTKDSSIFLTISPCHRCIPVLINAGIKNVYFLKNYKSESEIYLINLYKKHFDNFKQITL